MAYLDLSMFFRGIFIVCLISSINFISNAHAELGFSKLSIMVSFLVAGPKGRDHKYAVIRHYGELSDGSCKGEDYLTDYTMVDFDDMNKEQLINLFSVGKVPSLPEGKETTLTKEKLDDMILKATPEFQTSSFGVADKPEFREVMNTIRVNNGDNTIEEGSIWLEMRRDPKYQVDFSIKPEDKYADTANEFFEKVNKCLGVDYLKVDLSAYLNEAKAIKDYAEKKKQEEAAYLSEKEHQNDFSFVSGQGPVSLTYGGVTQFGSIVDKH
jgi:hypothetical protein